MKPSVLRVEKTHVQKVYDYGTTLYEHVFIVSMSNKVNVEVRMVSNSETSEFEQDEVIECSYLKYNEMMDI